MAITPKDAILVLNSGSSSLKFGLFGCGLGDEELLLSGSAEGIGRQNGTMQIHAADGTMLGCWDPILESQPDALKKLASVLEQHFHATPIAVGHRIVHGGPHLREHQRLTDQVFQQLEAAVHFAPLHIPAALGLIREAEEIFSTAIPFACFDTAFHHTMPEVATHLPLPRRFFDQGVIRFGFHGLSYESVVYRLGSDLPKRSIFAHLGNGSSVTAVEDGRSIDTSMGLTPTGGVPMGTRTGDLDPGVLLYLLRTEKLSADDLETLVNCDSGLSGLSGGESDMQALLKRAEANEAAAELAVDAFCTAVRKCIGAYAALLGGVDLLVFTGGIGEHSETIRKRVCDRLGFLGLDVNDARGKVRVLPAQEELQMARHCRALLHHA